MLVVDLVDVMEQNPSDREPKASVAGYLWPLALGIGIAVGAGIGVAPGSIIAGVGISAAVGVAVEFFLARRFSSSPSDD